MLLKCTIFVLVKFSEIDGFFKDFRNRENEKVFKKKLLPKKACSHQKDSAISLVDFLNVEPLVNVMFTRMYALHKDTC